MEVNNRTNVTVATFCTSYDRMKLCRLMHRLEGHILYHYTDSIIYTYLPHQLYPDMGTFLGELTDELTCKNVGLKGVWRDTG